MSELDRATPIAEVKTGKTYMFYGVGGTGKTRLALMHPGKRKLIIDVDEKAHELIGMLTPDQQASIQVWKPEVPLVTGDIPIATVDPKRRDIYNTGTILTKEPLGFKRIIDLLNDLLRLSNKGEYPFDVTILDSLTRVVDHLIYSVMYHHKVSNMTQTLFGVVGTNLKNLLSGFLNLSGDRILIAHEIHQEKRDEDSGAIIWERIRPHVHGSNAIREELNTMFSENWRFLGRQTNGKYLIQTASSRLAPARTTKKLEFETEIDATKLYA